MSESRQDETIEYWQTFSHDDLAHRTAVLHAQRRELSEQIIAERVNGARFAVSALFLAGEGIEIGAGTRPVPVADGVTVTYGDRLSAAEQKAYFKSDQIGIDRQGFIDAQTLAGIDDSSQDFIISAHVVEHLENPIASIVHAVRVLKPGGVYLLIVPDKRYTFDVDRPETSVQHVVQDYIDGGDGTRLEACREHLMYVHPKFDYPISPEKIEAMAQEMALGRPDLHYHCWSRHGFEALLVETMKFTEFRIEAGITVVNENIFVLRKQ